ncbi:MAG: hypothetical protein ACUVV4_06455 [Candidatus Bathyarchaeia archaeon]
MSIRGSIRWILDRILIAFSAAILVVNGSSFGIDPMNKGLLYNFEVFLTLTVLVGIITYLIIPGSKSKTNHKS